MSAKQALEAAIAALKSMAKPVVTHKERAQVAAISAHNDSAIGELVADAMEKVGGDGVITVEGSKTTETVLTVVAGLQFYRGYLSPYFVTDPGTMEAVLEDAYVLACDRKLNAIKSVLPLLEQLAKATAEALGTGDERAGARIPRRALQAPARQIAENCAADGGAVVDRMLNSSGNTGFDAARKQCVDLLEAGIVDPAKDVRSAECCRQTEPLRTDGQAAPEIGPDRAAAGQALPRSSGRSQTDPRARAAHIRAAVGLPNREPWRIMGSSARPDSRRDRPKECTDVA